MIVINLFTTLTFCKYQFGSRVESFIFITKHIVSSWHHLQPGQAQGESTSHCNYKQRGITSLRKLETFAASRCLVEHRELKGKCLLPKVTNRCPDPAIHVFIFLFFWRKVNLAFLPLGIFFFFFLEWGTRVILYCHVSSFTNHSPVTRWCIS